MGGAATAAVDLVVAGVAHALGVDGRGGALVGVDRDAAGRVEELEGGGIEQRGRAAGTLRTEDAATFAAMLLAQKSNFDQLGALERGGDKLWVRTCLRFSIVKGLRQTKMSQRDACESGCVVARARGDGD